MILELIWVDVHKQALNFLSKEIFDKKYRMCEDKNLKDYM